MVGKKIKSKINSGHVKTTWNSHSASILEHSHTTASPSVWGYICPETVGLSSWDWIYKPHKVQSIYYLALCRSVLTSHLLYKGLTHKKTMRPSKISRRRRFFFNIFLLILFYPFILIYLLYTFNISPRVCSSSCPLSQWCYLIISSSVALFSLCLHSFPASGSFPMSRLFASEIFIISSEITSYLVRDNLLQYH